jgi:hypothetical protein
MIHQVIAAKGRQDFTVDVTFEDDQRADINLAEFVATGDVTAPLRADPSFFVSELRVVQNGDAIGWPGDVEIDADALWYKAHPEDWHRDYGDRPLQSGTGSV